MLRKLYLISGPNLRKWSTYIWTMKRLCQQNLFNSEVPYSLKLYNVNLHLCAGTWVANVYLGLQTSKTETDTRKKSK
jgi:hypothetical protein